MTTFFFGKWKTASILKQGRQAQIFELGRRPWIVQVGRQSQILASKALAELGTALPQLVSSSSTSLNFFMRLLLLSINRETG